MMCLRYVPDMDRFLNVVGQAHGDVMLHLDNGETCSLKHSSLARSILKEMDLGRHGLNISTSEPRDFASIVQYMMESSKLQ